ncbi:hypothetical protein GGI04_004017 [Coemansia thaxteri]|uniref:Aminopeptidase P N-terminal domain-containing protein n=1 Tax=Coemansia thaxteri TaxID=2663907 RepID=A0A9W8BKY6_9FUNG|nr:hypothetical protein GGI04_004017 [Coemansia thaxteri]KAJ2006482.1 hypothetical protein H4R26_001359 [Coemansia thaxteri]KAJ2465942.1 hypothetical protein GGI02_004536 [Coemansia sp. RSA 2322]KAJ2484807.1 hypothetical protein EV174_002150 [Coemansia sp. RSA 2320]
MSIYPAKQHLAATAAQLGADAGVILVFGGSTLVHPDSDTEYEFHQDSNFFYLSGVNEPGFAAAYDVASRTAILFARHVSADEAVWIGEQPSLRELCATYGFDAAHPVAEISAVISGLRPAAVYTLPESAERVAALGSGSWVLPEAALLRAAVHEARVFKDDAEIAIMRRANQISSAAHEALMRSARAGDAEAALRGRFVGLTLARGAQYEAYGSIVAGGRSAAVLHYTRNGGALADGDVVLVDAGATCGGYASDITRTWPVGARFGAEARAIYGVVLDMQRAVLAACAPGRLWEDMHALACAEAARGLLRLGLLRGAADSIAANHVVGFFMPHGIGHLIGIDTHDVGGYPPGTPRIDAPGLRYLRARREMRARMAFTVEPGLYFVDAVLAQARATPAVAQHIDFDVVARYRGVGGVRIEDNIVITESGHENLTTCPKEIEAIEALRAEAYASEATTVA